MSVVDVRLGAIEARLAALESRASGSAPASSGGSTGGCSVATDADLDSEYGDEVIKKDPKKWADLGRESYVGCRMSECPAEYLRMLASLFDWMAGKDEEQSKTYTNKKGQEVLVGPINRSKARKARGWAMRADQRAASAPVESPSEPASDDDIPF